MRQTAFRNFRISCVIRPYFLRYAKDFLKLSSPVLEIIVVKNIFGNAISCVVWQWHFSSWPIAGHVDAATLVSLIHVCTYVSHVHFWHGREHGRPAYGKDTYAAFTRGLHLRNSPAGSASFEKRHPFLLDKFQRDSRRYRDNGHFSFCTRSSPCNSPTCYIRVTTVSCLELLLQSAPISHRLPSRDVINYYIVSGSQGEPASEYSSNAIFSEIQASLGLFDDRFSYGLSDGSIYFTRTIYFKRKN